MNKPNYKIGQTLIYAGTVAVRVISINGFKFTVEKLLDGTKWETGFDLLDDDINSYNLRMKATGRSEKCL